MFEPQASADLAVTPPHPNLMQQTVDGAGGGGGGLQQRCP